MRTLDAVARLFPAASAVEPWRASWREEDAADKSVPEFLRAGFVRGECDRIGLGAEAREALVEALALFEAHPDLLPLARHCRRRLFERGVPPRETWAEAGAWPPFPATIHPRAPLFYALVLLSNAPAVRELHRAHGVPEETTRATLADMELWMRHCRRTEGDWGLREQGWLAAHFQGELYALGRLQFRCEIYDRPHVAYRHRATGRVRLLAGGGLRFRGDGQVDGTGGVTDPQAWEARLATTAESVAGHPVSPEGGAGPEAVSLNRAEWEPILERGDPVLGVHIPATGSMKHEACMEAFRRAAAFFPAHFPRRPFRAFTCESWLLDGQFDPVLPPEANIRRFLRTWYLYPIPGATDEQTFERVFGRRYDAIAEAPRETSLQRIVAAHVEAGGHWRMGGGLLFPADLDGGAEPYRAHSSSA